ncbi:phage/conjugal plasmid C-4 type zinc finger TraR family protein [Pseudomonas extremaustralis]|nr:TraR/DksA C4-type zinc finger protein [Pseudomonas extremaustralis]MDR6580748.1 phage/conjugal plasmid C-4 type zinc finger TraR family protein [Pseudomonas extremaustralis]
MADTVDIANEQVERFLQLALNRRQRPTCPVSAQLCMDCGEPIPLLRQRTIQGCVTCVSCQELWEQRQ